MMSSKAPGNDDRRETAVYIADLSGHLAEMARHHGLSTLGYILDMAKMAAEEAIRNNGRDGR